MRAFNEVVAFVLLLLFMVVLLAIIFPYYIQAGKKSAELTTAASEPAAKQIQASVIILDVEPYSGNSTCVVIKNTGATTLKHFKLYYVQNSTVVQFSYSSINITDLCSCEYGAPSDSLDPGDCGYVILPVNYSIIKGRTLYLVSDYDTSTAYIVG